MTAIPSATVESRPIWRAGAAALTLLALSAAHHLLGAALYQLAFRKHVAIAIAPTAALLVLLLVLGARGPDGLRGRALQIAAAIIFILAAGLGLFEGGYNHLLKVVLYASPLSLDTWRHLYPGPMYEAPSNLGFEATGIAQFPLGLLAGWEALRLWRDASATLRAGASSARG